MMKSVSAVRSMSKTPRSPYRASTSSVAVSTMRRNVAARSNTGFPSRSTP